MADQKRFYWLKLERGFFKRHDLKIIESMPNGKDYVLFYLKLLCESLDHDGRLRFSEDVPYDAEMLAVITDTNVDIAKKAIEKLTKLNMMGILDDGTYCMTAVERMIGSNADNDNANRQRRFREKQKQQALEDRYNGVTENSECVTARVTKNNDTVTARNGGVTECVTEDNESIEYREKSTDYRDKSIEYREGSTENRNGSIENDNTHTGNEYNKRTTTRAREEDRIANDEAWRTSKRARGAVAQRVVDEMRDMKLEHAGYPIIYDTVLGALEDGIAPEEILHAAQQKDYIDFNLWIKAQRERALHCRLSAAGTGPGLNR